MASRAATGGRPGMLFLLQRLRPAVAGEPGEPGEIVVKIFVTEPAWALGADW